MVIQCRMLMRPVADVALGEHGGQPMLAQNRFGKSPTEWEFVLALGIIPVVSIVIGVGFSVWSWLTA
jgi:hypothetical protein